jgi:hypothetical protein
VAVAAIAASVAGLLNDFVYDDIPLIQDNARVHDLTRLTEIFTSAYWPPPFVEQLYRPLAVALIAAQYAIGHGSPLVFRVVSYALYAIGAVLVYRLASRLLTGEFALAVALLFATHPVHVEAVALGVNQNELVVGIAGVVMVTRYLDARRRGGPTRSDWSFLAAAYAIAAFMKENAFVLPALLVAAEILLVDAPRHARVDRVWRGFATLAVVGIALIVLRTIILGDHFASVPNHAFDNVGVVGRTLVMLQVVTIWARLFAWPAHLQADYTVADLTHPGAFGALEACGLLLLILVGVAMWSTRRRAPVIAFGLMWCAIALVPVSNIVPTGILVAERTLYLPSIGFLLAAGGIAQELVRHAGARTATVRRTLVAMCVLLATLGLLRSAGRHRVWNTAHLRVVHRSPPT